LGGGGGGFPFGGRGKKEEHATILNYSIHPVEKKKKGLVIYPSRQNKVREEERGMGSAGGGKREEKKKWPPRFEKEKRGQFGNLIFGFEEKKEEGG